MHVLGPNRVASTLLASRLSGLVAAAALHAFRADMHAFARPDASRKLADTPLPTFRSIIRTKGWAFT